MSALRLVLRALVTGPGRRHPMRLLLPVVGVAVGVAAIAAIHHANRSVTESFREAAATVSGRSDFTIAGVGGVPVDTMRKLSFLWDSGSFAPSVTGTLVLQDGTGEAIDLLGVDVGGDRSVRDWELVEPRDRSRLLAAAANGSIFLTVDFARRHGLSAGSQMRAVAGGVPRKLTVGGLLAFRGVAGAAAEDLAVADLFTAQRILGKEGRLDRIDIALGENADRAAVRRRVAAALPPGLSIVPPDRSAASADRMVRAFRFNLNALGSLTLLVGVFLIANAVSVSVLRRRPEIATLKAVGASRETIFAAFVLEGLGIGVAGTLLGEAGGIVLARAALAAVSSTVSNIYLPTARIASAGFARPALFAAVVGLVSSLAAAVLPAAEAVRVPPSPAMRAGSVESVRRSHMRARVVAAVFAVAAAAALSFAPAVDGFPFFGFAGVALVVAALALVAPGLVRAGSRAFASPLRRALGAPGPLGARFFGGALARNGIAVAALAMALGMTLAMIVTVESIRETVRVWVETTLRSDLWVKSAAGKSSGLVGDLPGEVLPFLQSIPGVAAMDPFRAREASLRGLPFTFGSGDFRVFARIGGLPFLDGQDPARAAERARAYGEALVSEPFARRFGVRTGEEVALPTPAGPRSFRVAGVYRDYSNDRGTVVIDRSLWIPIFSDTRVTSVALMTSPGTEPSELKRRIAAAARGRFALSISTNRDLRREVLRIFDRTFAVTRGLEAIAISVAILGIANALMASAVERRRAFGLLRAIGASRGQIRSAVLVEAALTGSVAVAAAVGAGGAFAYLLLAVINPQSFGWTVSLSVPGGRLAEAAALVFAASILAGILPGRVAAAVDPAAALAEE